MLEELNKSANLKRRRKHLRGDLPTVADIARAAGVSTATVSRALNQSGTVSEQLKNRVEKVVKELGYVPSGAASALASSRSFTIGTVVPTLDNTIFYSSIAAFEAELSDHGYTMLVTVSNYDQDHEYQQLRKLLQRGVDAIMLVGLDHLPECWRLLQRARCPVVSIWSPPNEQLDVPALGFDNADAAHRITDHLVELGHSRIAMIAGLTTGNDRAAARKQGVEDSLKQHQLQIDPALFIEKPYSHQHGRDAFGELMRHANPPTAIICGNDVLAMGCLFEAQAQNISVPDQVSIAGYDNLPITRHISPALTTVDIPSKAMGKHAARQLVEHLQTGAAIQNQLFQAPLLVRDTTGPVATDNIP